MGHSILFDNLEWILIAASALSASMSFFVVLTSIVFGDMGKRPFMRIIFWISFCDLVGSVCGAFGFPPNSSPLCPIQSFVLVSFFKASWMWIVVLCYQMNYFLKFGRFGLRPWQMHIIIWSLSFGTSLMPLAAVEYGRDDDPAGWCFLTNGTSGSKVTFYWGLATFNIVLIICLVTMITLSILMYVRFRGLTDTVRQNVVHIVHGFYLYPLGMMVVWLPGCIISAASNANALDRRFNTVLAFGILAVVNTQNGTITALIFMMLSKESWQRWHRLILFQCCNQVTNNGADEESWKEIIRRYENDTDVSQDVFSDTGSVYTVDMQSNRNSVGLGVFTQDSNLTSMHSSKGYGRSAEMTISKASQSGEVARLRGEIASATGTESTSSSISSLFSLSNKGNPSSPSLSCASTSSTSLATSPFFRQQHRIESRSISQSHKNAFFVGTLTSSITIPTHPSSSPSSVRPSKPRSTYTDSEDKLTEKDATIVNLGRVNGTTHSTPEFLESSQMSSSFVHGDCSVGIDADGGGTKFLSTPSMTVVSPLSALPSIRESQSDP
jgi:hypothetical protein